MAEQAGRVALVTGANTGIGFEAALQLARKGAHVLLGCRDQRRAEQAIERIQAVAPTASLKWLPLDLADLASVKAAAAQLRADHQQLDVLICNAGVMVPPEGRTADGFELQFGINHLGHFALVLQLLPLLPLLPLLTSPIRALWPPKQLPLIRQVECVGAVLWSTRQCNIACAPSTSQRTC